MSLSPICPKVRHDRPSVFPDRNSTIRAPIPDCPDVYACLTQAGRNQWTLFARRRCCSLESSWSPPRFSGWSVAPASRCWTGPTGDRLPCPRPLKFWRETEITRRIIEIIITKCFFFFFKQFCKSYNIFENTQNFWNTNFCNWKFDHFFFFFFFSFNQEFHWKSVLKNSQNVETREKKILSKINRNFLNLSNSNRAICQWFVTEVLHLFRHTCGEVTQNRQTNFRSSPLPCGAFVHNLEWISQQTSLSETFPRPLINKNVHACVIRGQWTDYIAEPLITNGTIHVEITHRRSDSIQRPGPRAERGNPSSRWHTCRRTLTRCRWYRCTTGTPSSLWVQLHNPPMVSTAKNQTDFPASCHVYRCLQFSFGGGLEDSSIYFLYFDLRTTREKNLYNNPISNLKLQSIWLRTVTSDQIRVQ